MPQSTADYAFRKRNDELDRYINLKLVALGQPPNRNTAGSDLVEIAGPLLRNYYQKDQLLAGRLCPADSRIQTFLDGHLGDVCPSEVARFPANTFVLDREGMAALYALIARRHRDEGVSFILSSHQPLAEQALPEMQELVLLEQHIELT